MKSLSAWMCLLLPLTGLAQEGDAVLERIEVTGARISYEDLAGTPAISIRRPGDYLLQEMRLGNDSRDPEVRRRELHESIAALLQAAGTRYRLLHGDAYRTVLTRGSHRVDPVEDEDRPDSSSVTLHLRAELEGGASTAEARVLALREFIRGTKGVGRTQIEPVGDTALGMTRPERFRYELIADIARDTREVARALGSGCVVAIEGLNARIEWERVSAGELLLYIPYSMEVRDCRVAEDLPQQ